MNRAYSVLFATVLSMMVAITAFGSETVTFNKHIAPILFHNCSACHRPGEVAPFDLLTFEVAHKRSKQIARVVGQGLMPPWKAEAGHGEFRDARNLTPEQVALFKAWNEAGAPEGDPKDLPPLPKFTDGWQLGEPDMILTMPEEFTVPAEGRDVFRCFVLPFNNDEDLNVRAVEYRPGNRRVVHHALLFLDSSGAARKKDEADPGPGYTAFGGPGFIPSGGLGGWAPGATPHPLPDGIAKTVKQHSDLALQVHFHPNGKEEKERSQIGIYFTKETPRRSTAGLALGTRKIDIPPGDANYTVRDSMTLPIDLELLTVTPHAHLICKEIRADATLPDGTVKPIIWIRDWDFNWQDQYMYKEPMKLPKGTRLDVFFRYDNTADNLNNPNNPPKRVTFGEQTTNEMAFLFMQGIVDSKMEQMQLLLAMAAKRLGGGVGPGAANVVGGGDTSNLRKGFFQELRKKYDKDGDGKLSPEEIEEARKVFGK
jgi:mono/diheme cytochrome c family protein